METSYYNKSKTNPNAISIAGRCPSDFNGVEYKKLAPKYSFFKRYKEDGDKEVYVREYVRLVLDPLDAQETYDELCSLVEGEPILLCWEHSQLFCHRHIVSDWFAYTLGITLTEIQ